MSIPVPYSGNPMDGWCLVGNAYPSAVDLSLASVTWTKIYQTAWFWDPIAANYVSYIVGGTGLHSKYAPPQQGFFVRHDTTDYSGPGSLAMTNNARLINAEPFLKSDNSLADYLVLTATKDNSEMNDKTVVHFRDDATIAYDDIYDAFKLEGDLQAPQLYSRIPSEKVCVNSLPWISEEQVVPVGFYCGVSGNFEIMADNLASFQDGIKIYLEDLKETNMQELTENPSYPFVYHQGDNPDRFLLHFVNPFVGSEEKEIAQFQVYAYEDAVYVKNLIAAGMQGDLKMFDQTGRLVFSATLQNIPLNVFRPQVTDGFYMVTVNNEHAVKTVKVYLHQN